MSHRSGSARLATLSTLALARSIALPTRLIYNTPLTSTEYDPPITSEEYRGRPNCSLTLDRMASSNREVFRSTPPPVPAEALIRSEEHTSELQSPYVISYAV